MKSAKDELIELGYIAGFYGLKGWLKIYSFSNPRKNILAYDNWILQSENYIKQVKIKKGKEHGKGIIVSIVGYEDRNAVEELLKAKIFIKTSQLPALQENEFYWKDLIGFNVINQQNQTLGNVHGVIDNKVHDIMEIKNKEQKSFLIPWVKQHFIINVDKKEKTILVDWEIEK